MTESQENLRIAIANEKFWQYMAQEKAKILQEEIEKVELAQKKFEQTICKIKTAPEKLIHARNSVSHWEKQVDLEQQIPATSRSEILSLIEVMKLRLRKMGIAC